MVPSAKILCSILLASVVLLHNVEARKGSFYSKEPVPNNTIARRQATGYMDPKEYYPTGTDNSNNGYYGSSEGQRSGYGNGAGEGGGYGEGVNGYGRGAEYATEKATGEGYYGEGSGNGGGYGSGEWRGSNGGGGNGQGGEYASGYGGYNNQYGNGNGYGAGSGGGFGNGNGNGEYVPNNGYSQENP